MKFKLIKRIMENDDPVMIVVAAIIGMACVIVIAVALTILGMLISAG